MNIKRWLQNIKNKNNTLATSNREDIISALSVFPMPLRETFNNDDLIDFYKKEYLEKLANLKNIDVLGLVAEDLQNDIRMYINLVLATINNTDNIEEITDYKRLDYLIKCSVLDIYQKNIEKMQAEATARLIALNEIRKENKFLGRNKKRAIERERDSLYISLYTLFNQKYAIKSSISNYQNQSKYDYNPSEEEKSKEYTLLEEEVERLKYLEQILPLDEQISIRNDVNFLLSDSLLRKNLAVYAYKNKVEGLKLKEIFYNLQNSGLNDLKQINELERAFLVFNEFGYNTITDEDVVEFYNYKFKLLTNDGKGLTEVFINDAPDRVAKENYRRIILKMIENILKDANKDLKKIAGNDYSEFINLFLLVLKNGTNTINPDTILNNYYLLNFLITFYNNNLDLFLNIMNKEHRYNINKDDEYGCFFWNDSIPLKTFLYIMHFKSGKNLLTLHHNDKAYDVCDNLSDFYYFYKNLTTSENLYYLPDGLDTIDTNFQSKSGWDRRIMFDIEKNSKGKILMIPFSLGGLCFRGHFTDATVFLEQNLKGINKENGISLNNGFAELINVDFRNAKFSFLEVPSSMNTFYGCKFNPKALKKLIINDISDNYAYLYQNDEKWLESYQVGGHWLFQLLIQFSDVVKKDGKFYLKSNFKEIVFHNTQSNSDTIFEQDLTEIEISEKDFIDLIAYKRIFNSESIGDLFIQNVKHNNARNAIFKLEINFYKQAKMVLEKDRDKGITI